MSRIACVLFAALACGSVLAQSFSTLEERMNGREFREAGLEKLSPEELAALNAWLQREFGSAAAAPAPSEPFDTYGLRDIREEGSLSSAVVGTFTGWVKGTQITLANGQVWEVVDPDKFSVRVENAVANIRPGVFGAYFIRIEGYNSQTRVKRIR